MRIIRDYQVRYTNKKDTYRHCVNIILKLKKFKQHYIGATKDEQDRLENHIKVKNMKNMFVLVTNVEKEQAIELERLLIKRFKSESKTNRCINQGGGGEGIVEGENSIYILFR